METRQDADAAAPARGEDAEVSRVRTGKRHVMLRHAAVVHWRASRLDGVVRGLLWSMASGALFAVLNTMMRKLSLELSPYQTQFLRYFFSGFVMLPLVVRAGFAYYR